MRAELQASLNPLQNMVRYLWLIDPMNLRHLVAAAVFGVLLPPHAWSQHDHSKEGQQPDKPRASKSAKPLPAEGASVKIISPMQGQVFKGDRVPIQFKLVKGKKGHHVHAYVDGELMGMFESEKGTLTGVKPGRHILELRVLMADHETYLNASDRVEFVVK
ncbi:MAG TPA: hypothetical protein VNM15_06575 [Candidatus Binatia bacterium]|nr:hypothetical protein [Candidatus Binatia bacterium]